jgi:hypothetical protein
MTEIIIVVVLLFFCNLSNADFSLQRCPSDKIHLWSPGGTSANVYTVEVLLSGL